jgi:hypothetical protein
MESSIPKLLVGVDTDLAGAIIYSNPNESKIFFQN